MKVSVIIVFFLLTVGAWTGASGITIRNFLATAKNDYTVNHQDEKIDFLESSSSNTPFFDRVEFRTETDNFEFPRQRYSLRFYPNGWGETANGKKVYETTLAYNESQRDLLLHQALKKRYVMVIDFLHTRNILDLTKNLLTLQEDRVRVLKERSGSLDFALNDLLEAEDDYTRLQLELIDLENRRSSIEDTIRVYSPKDATLEGDANSLAGIDVIKKNLEALAAADKDNVYLRNSRARLELALWRYELEKSSGKKYISYLEAHYDNEERHDTSEAVSLELGIRFPFIDANRLTTNQRMLSYLSEKGACEELERTLPENMARLLADLKKLIAQHEILATNQKEGIAAFSLEMYQRLEGVDPLILLKTKESVLARAISLGKIQHQIYAQYLELLDLMGTLSEKPLKNWLAATDEQVLP